jgi:hypothetical protein
MRHRHRLFSAAVIATLGGVAAAFGASPDLIFIDAFEPVNFRIDDMDLRDPHVFVNFAGCRDLTDTLFAGYSVNGSLQTSIQTDSDNDGLLDLSYLLRLYPFSESDGAIGAADFTGADCRAPLLSTQCTANASASVQTTYTSQLAGTCLAAVPGTTGSYLPTISTPAAPCFSTASATVQVNFLGTAVTLHEARIAATYDSGPTNLINGLVTGFVSEADANATILPSTLPLVGGQPLSALLAGGTGSCPAYSDKDSISGVSGWQFYLNFTATRVNYTE